MKQKKTGKVNIWKWLFLTLLALVLGLGIVLISRIVVPREDLSQLVATNAEDTKIGTFTTNREQLNETLANYLEDYQTEDFAYKLYASNQQILFEGSYMVLGTQIPLDIYLHPSKLEDGSVLLTITEISAGSLNLPKSLILDYIEKHYKLPSFVQIDANAATVHIQLTALENKLGLYGKANTIDLYNDQIIVDIYRKVQK